MNPAVIRRAGPEELPALAWLRRQHAAELDDPGQDDPGFDAALADWWQHDAGPRVTWLADADGELAGMMNLAVFTRMPRLGRPVIRWGYLANAFVRAELRNRGVGGQLMDALLGYAREQELARVVLSPSPRSVPFYRRAGFGGADMLMAWTPG